MKKLLYALVATVGAVTAAQAEFGIANVTSEVGESGEVRVAYTLTGDESAIVTLDIEVQDAEGAWNALNGGVVKTLAPTSDACKVVEPGEHTIVWSAEADWPSVRTGNVRAVVKAWPKDNPPDYMAVALDGTSVRYYTAIDCLPGGILANPLYRTAVLVMRRIHAAGVPWTMGKGTTTPNKAHDVTLANDFYIGVFEVTQAQYYRITSFGASLDEVYKAPSNFKLEGYRAMRPVEGISYENVRNYEPGTAPKDTAALGRLRSMTGFDFDLPYESQWEFACRAGNDNTHWGDGSAYSGTKDDPNCPSRHRYNGGYINGATEPEPAETTTENGTMTVGSYPPNLWGLYDMHGNVSEWCLDRYCADLAANDADGDGILDSTAKPTTERICRGGYWTRAANEYAMSFARNRLASQAKATIGCRFALTLPETPSAEPCTGVSSAFTMSTSPREADGILKSAAFMMMVR